MHLNHTVESQPPSVQLAVFLNNIERVDSMTNQCLMDVILRTRYRKADFGETVVSAELIDGRVRIEKERRIEEDSGHVTVTEHFFASLFFSGRYEMFPFDRQTVPVVVQLGGLTSEEARFTPWPGGSGIRQAQGGLGLSRFKAEQFYVTSWAFDVSDHVEHGMPYSKSRGVLSITLGREVPFYWTTYVMLPGLTVVFSILAFCLPGTLMMPRVTISFASFLGMFVHVKQVLAVTPEGAQSWLATNAIFFSTVLCASMVSSIFSACVYGKNDKLAETHDAFVVTVLPCELFAGQLLFLLPPLRPWHKALGLSFVIVVLGLQAAALAQFIRRLDTANDSSSFKGGLVVVCPCCAPRVRRARQPHPPSEGDPLLPRPPYGGAGSGGISSRGTGSGVNGVVSAEALVDGDVADAEGEESSSEDDVLLLACASMTGAAVAPPVRLREPHAEDEDRGPHEHSARDHDHDHEQPEGEGEDGGDDGGGCD